MNTPSLLIITLVATSLIYSSFYLYIYRKSRNKYIAIWGFGWIVYSFNYFFTMLTAIDSAAIVFKYFFSIVSGFFLLLGTMKFVRSPLYDIIKPISYLSSLMILIFSIYIYWKNSSQLFASVFAFSSSLSLCIISVGTGIVFLLHEDAVSDELISKPSKDIVFDITAWSFILWGVHKGFYDFVTPGYDTSTWNYMSSILLTNILNISLVLTYSAQNNNEIRKSENLYRLLTENSKDIIASIRLYPEVRYSYLSPAIRTITGFDAEEFYGNPALFSSIIPEPDHAQYFSYLQNPDSSDGELIFRLNRKDQTEIWLEQHSTIFYDASGTPAHIEAIIRDITTRKKIEERLFDSESSRKKLVANISHELNTPITSIIGYLSVIQDNLLSSPANYMEYVRVCIDKSLILKSLIQDLFELSKLESGQIRFHYKEVNAFEFFQDMVGKLSIDMGKFCEWSVLTPDSRMSDSLTPGSRMPELRTPDSQLKDFIFIDRMRMEQVFRNIVNNSMNHMDSNGHILFSYDGKSMPAPQDGKSVPIPQDGGSKDSESAASYVVFGVTDNGVGISPEELPYIFDRFYRAGNSNPKSGTGLGLAICKEIIDNHNGIIWAESAETTGTAVYVALPKI